MRYTVTAKARNLEEALSFLLDWTRRKDATITAASILLTVEDGVVSAPEPEPRYPTTTRRTA